MAEGRRFIMCLLLVVACILQIVSGLTISACFKSNKTLDIDCGTGYMVHITRTFYGFSPTDKCRLVEDEAGAGCTVDDSIHYSCVGQSSCSINLPTGQWGVSVPACGQRSNYYQVEYKCVLASSVSDICQTEKLTAQSGYIMTPRYPSNYNKQGDCSTTIIAHPSQKLNLQIIQMDLASKNKSDCADMLYFNDKLRSITVCGQRTNHSYNMLSNYLHIELQSNSGGHSKGFWLYYEAVPPLPTSIQPPPVTDQKTSNSATNAPSSGGSLKQDTVSQDQGSDSIIMSTLGYNKNSKTTVPLHRNFSSSTPKPSLPFAVIAGSVIGTLSLILVILLLLLFIKWYKERQYYKAEKILEIRNPAFRSSSDFHDQQPNNGYYC